MRRNIYIRLLLSIVGITVLVMAVQLVMLLFSTRMAERSWKQHVFDGYVETLSSEFRGSSAITFADLLYTLVDSAPDRVSGLLVRDEKGDVSISIGSSSRGDFIPQPYERGRLFDVYSSSTVAFPNAFSISVNTTEDFDEREIAVPEYCINLTSHAFGGTLFVDDIRIEKSGLEGTMRVKIPDVIKNNDIAGSIVLYNNGVVYGYLDIIVFDIDVYGPTEMLIRDFSSKVLFFLPIAVLISLVAGYFISKRNTGMIREIRRALKELALGNYKVRVDKKLIAFDEFSMIADSIEQLGCDLERHRKSRKEWLRNISHDLNTPVTSMNILLSGAEDGVFPLNSELVKAVKKENDILSERIASVAYYSNLISSDKPMTLTRVPVVDLLSSSLEGRKRYSIKGDISEYEIQADYELAKRALKEIFDNAEEYGVPDEDVTISVRREDGFIAICVSNRGSLPRPMPSFFEPWARGDDSRHEGGSGLGLPIVHQIMEMHHGDVQIREDDGLVSVTLRFPE